jgi:hypothetical protein
MNYGVHALMYFYFFLTSCGYRPRWNGIVTFLQISQMFVGVAVCTAVAYYMFYVRGADVGFRVVTRPTFFSFAFSGTKSNLPTTRHLLTLFTPPPFSHTFPQLGVPCDITVSNFAAGILMYGSYFVLFALFAMGKYGAPSKKERKAKGKEPVTDEGEREAQEPPPAKGSRANKKRA